MILDMFLDIGLALLLGPSVLVALFILCCVLKELTPKGEDD